MAKYGDFIVVKAKHARRYADVLSQQMSDSVEQLIEQQKIDPNKRVRIMWTVEETEHVP